jgi:uncharacterized membrane protein SpoIIM required for sporulation
MTEKQFTEENRDTWLALEASMKQKTGDPAAMNRLFLKLSSDLSYARSFFPRRSISVYLNRLMKDLFQRMHVHKKPKVLNSIAHFYKSTLPQEIIRSRNALLVSLGLFILCMLIGAATTIENPDFARTILGDKYVNITENNINQGDPMAIYKGGTGASSFLGITVNNIRVAFLTFVMGIFFILGSVVILVQNGIMVGTFQAMFYNKGLLMPSFLTIWIHGTIEISSIVIAGGAGILLGSSLLLPGSYTRLQSLKRGALRSLTLILSTVPFFVIAGFLEGFVTRITDLHDFIKLSIIVSSMAIILFVYLIWPIFYYKKYGIIQDVEMTPEKMESEAIETFKELNPNFKAFKEFRNHIEAIFSRIVIPGVLLFMPVIFLESLDDTISFFQNDYLFYNVEATRPLFWLLCFVFGMYIVFVLHQFQRGNEGNFVFSARQFFKHYVIYFFCAIILMYPLLIDATYISAGLMVLLPLSISFTVLMALEDSRGNLSAISDGIKITYNYWSFILLITMFMVVAFLILKYNLLLLRYFIFDEVFLWHNLFINDNSMKFFLDQVTNVFLVLLLLPLYYFMVREVIMHYYYKKTSEDLRPNIDLFLEKNRK